MKMLKKALMLLVIPMAVAACSKDNNETGNNLPGPNEVWMKNRAFVPSSLTVPVGTTVTWTNKDNVDHNVTDSTLIVSGTIHPGGTFTFTFDSAGIYDYACTIHPDMTGSVLVNASAK